MNSDIEKLSGVVERVTFHNPQNGWSVIKVSPFQNPGQLVTVVLHQAQVFAGASMEFHGTWTHHPEHGEQFKATQVIEKKPASAAALEKYLGSGLIKGVGPATAARIVKYFKERTLSIFEENMEELKKVPGIADKKLEDIKKSWQEHKSIRDVMMFLQQYGISTLFSVKIYRHYGNEAIAKVSENPYRLARDIYGIGFFSADRVALAMGFNPKGVPRIEAGVKHVLSASRDEGHCYLKLSQIVERTQTLLQSTQDESNTIIEIDSKAIDEVVRSLQEAHEIKMRILEDQGVKVTCYYAKSLYYDEVTVAETLKLQMAQKWNWDEQKIRTWTEEFCKTHAIQLSPEQRESIIGIPIHGVSILTGGPGCGKTTSTKMLVQLLTAMKRRIVLAAPTGRAAQRMTEVIGLESKTIHRLLEWAPQKNGFQKDQNDRLDCDFLILDECSMLDISLAAAVFRALGPRTQLLLIGDPDQLPSVGAGNVLSDLIQSQVVPCFRLTQVFRQAQESLIIQYAHKINQGIMPQIASPIADPKILLQKDDCMFLDCEEATQEQVRFLQKAKMAFKSTAQGHELFIETKDQIQGKLSQEYGKLYIQNLMAPEIPNDLRADSIFHIPEKFLHVNLEDLMSAPNQVAEIKALFKKIHPWSTLHHGLSSIDTILRLYTKTIPDKLKHLSQKETQILCPQVRGTLGTLNLNRVLQQNINPPADNKPQVQIGEKIFRLGDRIIQTRNNYDLGVFNGDIGFIREIDFQDQICQIEFQGHEEPIEYGKEDLSDLQLAYAVTIHKSQGSEFPAVIIPIVSQHFKMLFRNLIYTGLTRAKSLAVFVGSRKALALAIGNIDQRVRQTALIELLRNIQ